MDITPKPQATLGLAMILGGGDFREDGPGAKNLQACLESMRPVAFDQIVLVDTGINEAARAVIDAESQWRESKQLAAIEVHPFQWCDNFAAARITRILGAKTL